MNKRKLSLDDRFSVPFSALSVGGMAYGYAYTMVPNRLFSTVGRFRSYPLHLFSPDYLMGQPLHVDFPVVVVGGNNERIYKFVSWVAFASSPVARLTADWSEVLAD